MASIWNGKPCPLCSEGTLHDDNKAQQMEYRGRVYEYTTRGAFCDHCQDGFPVHDEQEEAAWIAFRDKVDAEECAELVRIRRKLKLTQQAAASAPPASKTPKAATKKAATPAVAKRPAAAKRAPAKPRSE